MASSGKPSGPGHLANDPYLCDVCGRAFRTKEEYDTHRLHIKSYCEDLIVALALVLRIKNEASTRTALVEPKEMNHIRGSLLKIVMK